MGELDEGERFQLLRSLTSCSNIAFCALSSSLSSLWCKVKAGRDTVGWVGVRLVG